MEPGRSAEVAAPRRPRRLVGFIEAHQREIVDEWERAVRERSDGPTLVDDVPELLSRMLAAAALPPLAEDFDLAQLLAELSLLRQVVTQLWHRDADFAFEPTALEEIALLDAAVDGSVAEAVRLSCRARERAAQGAEKIAKDALESSRGSAEDALAVIDALLMAAPVGVAFVDTELRYVRVNAALAAINGSAVERHIGRSVREVLGDVEADQLEPMLRAVMSSREPVRNLDVTARPPSTRERDRHFLANFFPVVTAHDQVIGVGAVIIEITDRKHIEEELRVSEARLNAILQHAPLAIYMKDAERVLVANERFMQLERMQGRSNTDVEVLQTGRALETEEVVVVDGEARTFLSVTFPVPGPGGQSLVCGMSKDITERKRGENELRFLADASATLASSLDERTTLTRLARLAVPAIADWCVVDVVEDGGNIARVAVAHADPAKAAQANEYLQRYPADIDADIGPGHVIRTGEPEILAEVSSELLRASTLSPEHLALLEELGMRSYVCAPLLTRGAAIGAISVIRGPSRARFSGRDTALLDELGRRAGTSIDNARLFADGQHAVRMREEILAVVSHDLRNPLGAVQLALGMLLKQTVEPTMRKNALMIQRSARRMDALIGDLLDTASIQAGRLALDMKPEDIGEIAREVLELQAAAAKDKGIELVGEFPPSGHHVKCDRERVIQVLANLIGNSLKFCSPGAIIALRVEIGAEARISVRDSGPGIPAANLPHVFLPYWSGEHHAKKGTGLGLYISKGIVEAHGGRISVESTEGAGATFAFTLPLA